MGSFKINILNENIQKKMEEIKHIIGDGVKIFYKYQYSFQLVLKETVDFYLAICTEAERGHASNNFMNISPEKLLFIFIKLVSHQ